MVVARIDPVDFADSTAVASVCIDLADTLRTPVSVLAGAAAAAVFVHHVADCAWRFGKPLRDRKSISFPARCREGGG